MLSIERERMMLDSFRPDRCWGRRAWRNLRGFPPPRAAAEAVPDQFPQASLNWECAVPGLRCWRLTTWQPLRRGNPAPYACEGGAAGSKCRTKPKRTTQEPSWIVAYDTAYSGEPLPRTHPGFGGYGGRYL
jgi:hypothetical protein